jgi:hypothetical protein
MMPRLRQIRKRSPGFRFCLLVALSSFFVPAILAQDNSQGPLAPPPKFEVRRIPTEPHPGPPPMPQQQIIAKIAANEDAAQMAYTNYEFTESIRVEELANGGGKFSVTGYSYLKPDGQRYWRATTPVTTDLKTVKYDLPDVQTMISIPLFFLNSDQVGYYNFVYAGQQKLDEINAYMFQVQPRQLLRERKLFRGLIYVDDHDLAVVEAYGKFVSELSDSGEGTSLPFTMFEVYRENFQGKFWLPTYISSDDYLHQANADDLHIRLVVRSTDFKLVTPPAAQDSAQQKSSLAPQK